jgi:predicted permease
MKENLILQFAIFSLILVGFLVRKLGLVTEQGQKSLNNLVIYVVLPCNIFRAFLTADTAAIRADGLWVFGISLAFQFFCLVYGRVIFRRAPLPRFKCLRFATTCSNAGYLGNPVAEGLYGAEGLALANIYLIPLRTMMWSAGIAIFTDSHDRKATVKAVLTHPCIIAILLGVGLMLLKIQLPALLLRPINALSSCNTACSMLVIGMILSGIHPRELLDRSVLLFSLHRLVIIPALVYLACLLLPLEPMARGLCVILAAMPAAANTSMLADKYEQDPQYATRLVVVSTLLSIPTTAIWCLILA